MRIQIFQIDAFAEKPFEGNPAAVCPLPAWLPDATLQAIAAENNLSETAFYVKAGKGYHLRWFTPKAEVKLCGHATLATAFVLFNTTEKDSRQIEFDSLSGPLLVSRTGDNLELDFPAQPPTRCAPHPELAAAFPGGVFECWKTDDYFLVFENEKAVRAAAPSMEALKRLDLRGVCITAPGDSHDFVSRFFAPKYGIEEDPVTGSAHTQLAPYWSARLGKNPLRARQVSARGGELLCTLKGDRVLIAGKARQFLRGEIELPDGDPLSSGGSR